MTSTLVSKLAQKTKCAMIGLSCIRREGNNGFTVVCELLPEAIHDQDLRISVTALNQGVETMIRRTPAQYVWSYRRFKDAQDFRGVYRQSEINIMKLAEQRNR